MSDWQDTIVGDRMTVDQEFSPRVDSSPFSRQEWGLIMTATEFEIVSPGDPEAAELVADTDALPAMMPEIEKVGSMGPMGQPQGGGSSDESLLDSIRSAIGLGGGESGDDVDEERLEAAVELVGAYADELQAHLEEQGRWKSVRETAAGEPDDD